MLGYPTAKSKLAWVKVKVTRLSMLLHCIRNEHGWFEIHQPFLRFKSVVADISFPWKRFSRQNHAAQSCDWWTYEANLIVVLVWPVLELRAVELTGRNEKYCMVESANAPIATFIPQAVHILPNFWESKIATCKTFTRSLPQKGGNLVTK